MKVGVIGLGKIAEKAYLPVISAIPGIELLFASRNRDKLRFLADKYRVNQRVSNVDELIEKGIDIAFVHTSTESHGTIIKKLLENHIAVYVDKPISYSIEETREIVQLAQKNNTKMMVGFNRRYAPMYHRLRGEHESKILIMQKNRIESIKSIREVIYDDFIHIVDTLRFFTNGDINNFDVDSVVENGKLIQVILYLKGNGYTAIGIMNRNHAINEEILEYSIPKRKWIVKNLSEVIEYENNEEKS
ncbi:Gfo/Idh/MocA family oxidoreductase [Tepidibacillus marianensis]|uniref:Gfo/Idh/MocA family protein n=1 Tax=Tepidibacillus marianensis TaxID=3131995 RepID=UPI0030CFC694